MATNKDGFGLGVAVGLPGEHGQVIGGEAIVVEAFAGEVVVDSAVGGLSGCPQRPLDVREDADTPPTPTTIPVVDTSPSPGLSRFNSTLHGISIDFPSGWQIRSATEPWTQGRLNFDSPAADVIFDPALGDSLYIILASRSGASVLDSWPITESGVCDPEGGLSFGNFTVDGASAWYQDCDSGISGATDVSAVAVTTDNRGYLIVLVRSGEPGLNDVYDFEAALETVDLRPEQAR